MARERATLQVGAPAQRRSGAPEEEEQLPEWWNPTPALHVSLYYKEEVCSPWRISPASRQGISNRMASHKPSTSQQLVPSGALSCMCVELKSHGKAWV